MDDLKRRFATLDRIPMPGLWDDAVARSATRNRAVVGRMGWGPGASSTASFAWVLLIVVLSALLAGAVLVGALHVDQRIAPPRTDVPSPIANISPSDATAPTATPSATATCASRMPPTELRVVPIALPSIPADIVEGGCRVWAQLGGTETSIVRLDPMTNRIDASIAGAAFIKASGPAVWVEADPASGAPDDRVRLGRIDPETASWEPEVSVPRGRFVYLADDVIWLRQWRSWRTWVMRVGDDPSVEPREFAVLEGPLFAAFGSMWFGGPEHRILTRYGPADQRVLATIELGSPADCVETIRGFVCGSSDGHLIGVSAATNAVEWSVTIPGAATDLTTFVALGDSVWLLPIRVAPGRADADELIEVDVATGQVRRRLPFAVRQPTGMWGAGGSLWLVSVDPGVVRIDLPAGG